MTSTSTYGELSECGCNACYCDPSGHSEWCENGPYWHAEADKLAQALRIYEEENGKLREALVEARRTFRREGKTFFRCYACGHQHDDFLQECDVWSMLNDLFDQALLTKEGEG